jgi:hypothetical protein
MAKTNEGGTKTTQTGSTGIGQKTSTTKSEKGESDFKFIPATNRMGFRSMRERGTF